MMGFVAVGSVRRNVRLSQGTSRRNVSCEVDKVYPPEIVRQPRALRTLERILASEVPPRMLFSGPNGTGKAHLARWFFGRLQERGVIDQFRVFDSGARLLETRRYVENAKKGNLPNVNIAGIAVCESLLRAKESLLQAVRMPFSSPIRAVEIYMVEDMKDKVTPGVGKRLIEVQFLPLPDDECAAVLRDIDLVDMSTDRIALAWAGGRYEDVGYAHTFMQQVPLPWHVFRNVPQFGEWRTQMYTADRSAVESRGIGQARVMELMRAADAVSRHVRSRQLQLEVLDFVERMWTSDLETCLSYADEDERSLLLNEGRHAKLALDDARRKAGGGYIVRGIWCPLLMRVAGLSTR